MNRKQRRASGSRGAKPAFAAAADAGPAGTLADLFGAAVARHQAGALIEAERRYRHILTLFPGHAETHGMLGGALMAQGKAAEAIPHFERVRALRPDLLIAYEDLGRAYMAAGRLEAAIEAAGSALAVQETAQGRTFFAQCVKLVRFKVDDDRCRKLVLRALSEGWAPPRELTGACISLIKLNGVVTEGIARATSAWPARLPAPELCGSSGMAALSDDPLLCRLLECDPVTDVGLERLLTNARHAMLTASTAHGRTDGAGDERLLGFFCSVARQCFINGYVFSMTQDEQHQADGLRASFEQALAAGVPCSPFLPAIVGAYFPLHTLSKAEALFDRSWPQCVDALIKQQVKEPAEERQIAAALPVLTDIDDEVSRAVRQQYEESPYPRWVKAGPPRQPAARNDRQPKQVLDVLIAGCGTGLSAIEFAQQAPDARVVAIDLSRASLSYAKRMAHSIDLTTIEFGQADIMRLGSIGRQFDVIDASGVLHHLADPWQGWRLLLGLLRPGGAMQVGLYSEAARRNIVAARALIAARGYRPVAQDIRRAREDIIASADPVLKSVIRWEDFFAANECRDLLFHVQEHRITLPEIRSFLAANDVQFAGFLLDASTLRRFAMRFPEPAAMTDLDRWHAFETHAPDTFAAMYQFWVRKPAVRSGATTASPH